MIYLILLFVCPYLKEKNKEKHCRIDKINFSQWKEGKGNVLVSLKVFKKRVKTCSENMQQMYKILTTGKYDFNKVARQYLKIF